MMDPVLGRFTTPDPLSEKYYSVSPYVYCAADPVNKVDPDGRIIRVYDENGVYQWKQHNEAWGFYNDDNIMYSGQSKFINQLSLALNELMNGGNAGYDLVRNLANHTNIMTLMPSDYSGADQHNQVGWNPSGIRTDGTIEAVPTMKGLRNDPVMTLGHELSHIAYNWSGEESRIWFDLTISDRNGNSVQRSISTSEIFTTHMENLLRKENNLPLRTHYALTSNGFSMGPRIINRKGESMYYDAQGNTNFKRLNRKVVPYMY